LTAVQSLRRAQSRTRGLAYTVFGHLPPRVRRGVVGVVAPSFTVGALAVIHDGDEVLFVSALHRPGLALPGGLLKKGEPAREALAREVHEELGIDTAGFAATPDTAHVDPAKTRVDLIYFLHVDRATFAPRVGSEVLSFEWRSVRHDGLTPQTKEIIAAIAGRLPP
jgi:ADP-ribose pyrophosphatase YjhB (NUDIX family)